MNAITIAPVPWSSLPAADWQALVTSAFHPAYLGISEAYTGIATLADKLVELEATGEWSLVWQATADGRLVGLLVAELVGSRLFIYDIFVSPDHQRRGIGRRLVEAACAVPGVRQVGMEVNHANPASQALMHSLDFVTVRSSDWMERTLA